MVTLSFLDGTLLECELNGNTFITDTKPNFPTNLKTVTISGDENRILKNVQIIESFSPDGRFCFGLLETPESELEAEKLGAQILYTALLTDTLLEDE